jgi:hypothetical protein
MGGAAASYFIPFPVHLFFMTKNLTPSPEQIAEQFDIQPLEQRLEMINPYGRDEEQERPTGATPENPLGQ